MGFKVDAFPYELRVGNDLNNSSNLQQMCLNNENNFDFILVDIANKLNFRDVKTSDTRKISLARSGKI